MGCAVFAQAPRHPGPTPSLLRTARDSNGQRVTLRTKFGKYNRAAAGGHCGHPKPFAARYCKMKFNHGFFLNRELAARVRCAKVVLRTKFGKYNRAAAGGHCGHPKPFAAR